jgi:tetratricopeptide (TPR) repeat protein
MVAEDGFDTAAAISALESTTSLFSSVLQLASVAFQFVPGMAGAAGVLSGISSGFDNAGKVLDGIDQVRALCNEVLEVYDRHPDPAVHPQVAAALITKAFTLNERGRYAEALSVYDELAHRFGADVDPSVARFIRWARINATAMLNKLRRFEETLPRCAEIVERYGGDPDPAVVADVLSARLNRMEALTELHQTGEALSCFDEIISICDGFGTGGGQDLEIRIRQDYVSALAMKSMILLSQGDFGGALALSGELVKRFGADPDVEVRNAAERSLLALLDAYNIVLARAEERSLKAIALNTGYGRIQFLLQVGRFKDAVHACDHMGKEFRSDLTVQVKTSALKVEGYRGLGRHKKALKACDEIADLTGPDPDVESRQRLAHVLRLKTQSLWALHRGEEIPPVCDEIDRRFGDDPDLVLRQEVAQALLDKGRALGQNRRGYEAMAVMDTVVARYGEDADPVLREMSARARSNKITLARIGAGAEDHPPPDRSR